MTRPRLLRAPSGVTRRVVLVAAVLALLAALLGTAAWFRTPGRTLVIGLSAAAPYLLPAGLVALVLFAVARQWVGVGVAALVAVFWIVTQAPAQVAADPPAHARHLTVLTANLHLGEADAAPLVAQVRRDHVQVLMVEELTAEAQQRLVEAGIEKVLPHRLTAPSGAALGTGMWSRYPLQRVRTEALSFESVVARVSVPGVTPRPTVAAVHPAGPYPDSTSWHQDYARLPAWLDRLPAGAPVVVGGDFNATPSISQFRDLLDGDYRDASEQSGAGLLATYPADRWYPPLIGIDHVLTRDAVATSADTVDIANSDHLGLLVTVALPRTS